MSDHLVIRHCAPTLASIKTANLFSCEYETLEELYASIRSLNRRLSGKGLRILPLKCRDGRALIYVYRPNRLDQDLNNNRANELLRSCGYECCGTNRCIVRLIERLRGSEAFPHEIGLFLGYPPEDVEGFIYRRSEAKYTGYWKVYGDVESAQRSFQRYRRCTDSYLKQASKGLEIERLTVAF